MTTKKKTKTKPKPPIKIEPELPPVTDEEMDEAFLGGFDDYSVEDDKTYMIVYNLIRWDDGGLMFVANENKKDETHICLEYNQVVELHDVICDWLKLRNMANTDMEKN